MDNVVKQRIVWRTIATPLVGAPAIYMGYLLAKASNTPIILGIASGVMLMFGFMSAMLGIPQQ